MVQVVPICIEKPSPTFLNFERGRMSSPHADKAVVWVVTAYPALTITALAVHFSYSFFIHSIKGGVLVPKNSSDLGHYFFDP